MQQKIPTESSSPVFGITDTLVHIGMVLITDDTYPPDVRVDKEAYSLTCNGHRVTVLARRTSEDQSEEEKLGSNCFVYRIRIAKPSLFSEMLSRFTLIRYECTSVIEQFIKECKPEVLHVHDFDLVPTVLKAAKKTNLKVVADLHENMPAAFVSYRSALPIWRRFLASITKNYHLWRWHERRSLSQCERVIVVVPEAAERLYSYGIPEDRVIVVSNTEDGERFDANRELCDPGIMRRYRDEWMISYVGSVGPHRGLDTVMESLPTLRNRIPNLILTIIGAQPNKKKPIEVMAKALNVEDLVEIVDRQPYVKMKSYIFASRLCLVPHKDFEHTQTTVPHKLFQYMLCARPVLVSNCRPLARIVSETDAGYVFKTNDARSFAAKVLHAYTNPEEAEEKGKKGRIGALGPYSWVHDSKRLLSLYDGLL